MKKRLFNLSAAATLVLTLSACSAERQSGSIDLAGQNIVGGTETDDSSPVAKHVVAIVGMGASGPYTCTGTLITKNIVMTAAHCVPANKMKVVFTKNIQQTVTAQKQELIRTVVSKVVHPKWAGTVAVNGDNGDIALIKFDGNLPLGFAPAKVSISAALLQKEMTVLQIGFGMSNPEEKSGSGILRNSETTILGATGPSQIVVEQRQGRGVCFGDSGGPSFVKVNDEFVVWGVASAVTANPQCREYGIYTNVSAYGEWLKEAAASIATAAPNLN